MVDWCKYGTTVVDTSNKPWTKHRVRLRWLFTGTALLLMECWWNPAAGTPGYVRFTDSDLASWAPHDWSVLGGNPWESFHFRNHLSSMFSTFHAVTHVFWVTIHGLINFLSRILIHGQSILYILFLWNPEIQKSSMIHRIYVFLYVSARALSIPWRPLGPPSNGNCTFQEPAAIQVGQSSRSHLHIIHTWSCYDILMTSTESIGIIWNPWSSESDSSGTFRDHAQWAWLVLGTCSDWCLSIN